MPLPGVDGVPLPRLTKVIAVADVVESVRLMEEDEGEFIRRWKGFVSFVLERLPQETGRMHRSLGDGLMLEFTDPLGCIRAAFAMQGWFREVNERLPPEQQVHLRIGAHIGDFVADAYDIYGTDVNLAARIATLAGPGEIVISAALRERIRGPLNAQLEDLGTCHLKHVTLPVHAYRVGFAGRAPVMPAFIPVRLPMSATVAVLPFETSNTPPGCDGLGEAVADEAVAVLSRGDNLRVVSRLSTAALKQARPTLDEIRRRLGTRYVLSGHAREIGGHLAVFAELADAATGHIVWADSFKGALSDLLAGTAAFLGKLAPAVNAAVTANEVERAEGLPLPALEGYVLLLTAVVVMHRLGRADMERAKLMLEHLAERDRRHPAAYAWLAHWHVLKVLQGWSTREQEAPLAARYIDTAMQCDPQAPLVLCMSGHAAVHLAHDMRAAGRHYAQALSSRAYDPLPHLLHGEWLALRGDGPGALAACHEAARRTPPLALQYWYDAVTAMAAWVAGDLQQASAAAERSLRANDRFVPAHCMLAAALFESGDTETARDTIDRLLVMQPAFSVADFAGRLPVQRTLAARLLGALQGAATSAAAS